MFDFLQRYLPPLLSAEGLIKRMGLEVTLPMRLLTTAQSVIEANGLMATQSHKEITRSYNGHIESLFDKLSDANLFKSLLYRVLHGSIYICGTGRKLLLI